MLEKSVNFARMIRGGGGGGVGGVTIGGGIGRREGGQGLGNYLGSPCGVIDVDVPLF